MKKRSDKLRNTSVVLFVFLVLSTLAPLVQIAKSAPGVVLQSSIQNYNLVAGQDNVVRVNIRNSGDSAAFFVKAQLYAPSSVAGIGVVQGSVAVFDVINSSETKSFYSTISVGPAVPLGAYSLTLTLQHNASTLPETQYLGISVSSIKPSVLELKADALSYRVTAGAENVIVVKITNIGQETLYGVDLAIVSTLPNIVILKDAAVIRSSLGPGGSMTLKPLISVGKSVPLGAYALNLNARYRDQRGVSFGTTLNVGIVVESIVTKTFGFSLELSDYRVLAGADNPRILVVRNSGNETAFNVDLRLMSANPGIVFIGNTSILQNRLEPTQSVNISTIVSVARTTPIGTYPISISLRFQDPNGTQYADSLNTGLTVNSIEPINQGVVLVTDFETTPKTLLPGQDFSLDVSMVAQGAEVHNLKVELVQSQSIPIVSISPTTFYVGNVELGSQVRIHYQMQIGAHAEAQYYTLQFIASFLDEENTPGTTAQYVSLRVESVQDFQVINIDPLGTEIEAGGSTTLSADLLLIGTESARFVEISIMEESPVASVGKKSEYIGTVDPDSPVPFSLDYRVDPNATLGASVLSLRVSYWDQYNLQRESVVQIPITISQPVPTESQGLTIWDLIRILLGMRP